MSKHGHTPAQHAHAQHAHAPHEKPANLDAALLLVGQCAADCDAKCAALKPLQASFQKADEEAAQAAIKLKEAEESLLKVARAYRPDVVAPAPEPEKPAE